MQKSILLIFFFIASAAPAFAEDLFAAMAIGSVAVITDQPKAFAYCGTSDECMACDRKCRKDPNCTRLPPCMEAPCYVGRLGDENYGNHGLPPGYCSLPGYRR